MVEILQDKGGRRTVQLDISFGLYDHEMTLTVAHMAEDWVNLARLRETENTDEEGRILPNEKFALSFAEMNALGQAWSKFQFDLMIIKEEADAKLRKDLTEAQELAGKHGITVELNPHYEDHRYYIVRHPDYWRDDYVPPDCVLSSVKQAASSLEARKVIAKPVEPAVEPEEYDPLDL